MNKHRKLWIFLLTLFSIGVAVAAVAVWLQPRAFDRTVWLAHNNTAEAINPRQEMLTDLIQNKLKPGLIRAQVVTLLGKPAYTRVTASGIVFSYRVGDDGWGIDSNWLDVEFNVAGHLVKAYPVQT